MDTLEQRPDIDHYEVRVKNHDTGEVNSYTADWYPSMSHIVYRAVGAHTAKLRLHEDRIEIKNPDSNYPYEIEEIIVHRKETQENE